MNVKVNIFNANEVKRYLKSEVDKVNAAYLAELDRMAMKVVTAVRNGGNVSNWNDDTGNLRSSIGYVMLHDGRKISENFQMVNGRGAEGMANAKTFAEQLSSRYPTGLVIVFVAGMVYAEYVERIKSKKVLKGGEVLAKSLKDELERKWNAKYGK